MTDIETKNVVNCALSWVNFYILEIYAGATDLSNTEVDNISQCYSARMTHSHTGMVTRTECQRYKGQSQLSPLGPDIKVRAQRAPRHQVLQIARLDFLVAEATNV